MAKKRSRLAKATDNSRRSGPTRESATKRDMTVAGTDPYSITVSYSQSLGGGTRGGIVRGAPEDWFGPLNPLSPTAPAEVAGRAFDFPSGYNLATRPRAYEPVGFSQLRALADGYDLLRLMIETRKDEAESLAWTIVPRDEEARTGGKARQALASDKRILAAREFFAKPDGEHSWKAWLRQLLEDLFVVDAPALFVRRDRAGRMLTASPALGDPRYGLAIMDGGTLKRVIDDWGRTPLPYRDEASGEMLYPPAYQQILKGFPAINYVASDLIYLPRNLRSSRVYGYSPVEQIIMTVNIALRRQIWQLQYYTEGNIPDSLIGVPDTWSPQQIKDFQTWWDAMLEGDTAQRRHAKFVPGGVAKTFIATKEPELKNVFDEWLARVIAFAFSTSPQPLLAMMNRATAQTASETAKESGLEPIKGWIKGLIDGVLAQELAMPDLEFRFEEDDEVDPKAAQEILDSRVKAGVITINEARAKIGEDPYDTAKFPAADQPMVWTTAGYVPLDANTLEGKKAAQDMLGPSLTQGGAFGGDQGAGGGDDGGKPPPKKGGGKPGAGDEGGSKPPIAKRLAQASYRRLEPVSLDRREVRSATKSFRQEGDQASRGSRPED